MLTILQKNCRAAHLYNKLDMFLGYPWSKKPLQTAVISVCPPSGIFTVDKHPVIQAVDTFKPAYVVRRSCCSKYLLIR